MNLIPFDKIVSDPRWAKSDDETKHRIRVNWLDSLYSGVASGEISISQDVLDDRARKAGFSDQEIYHARAFNGISVKDEADRMRAAFVPSNPVGDAAMWGFRQADRLATNALTSGVDVAATAAAAPGLAKDIVLSHPAVNAYKAMADGIAAQLPGSPVGKIMGRASELITKAKQLDLPGEKWARDFLELTQQERAKAGVQPDIVAAFGEGKGIIDTAKKVSAAVQDNLVSFVFGQLPMMLAGEAGGVAGMAGLRKYAETYGEKDLTNEQRAWLAIGEGTLEALGESISTLPGLKALEKAGVDEKTFIQLGRAGVWQTLKMLAASSGKEGMEEAVTGITQNIWDRVVRGQKISLKDMGGIIKDGFSDFVNAIPMGAFMGGATVARGKMAYAAADNVSRTAIANMLGVDKSNLPEQYNSIEKREAAMREWMTQGKPIQKDAVTEESWTEGAKKRTQELVAKAKRLRELGIAYIANQQGIGVEFSPDMADEARRIMDELSDADTDALAVHAGEEWLKNELGMGGEELGQALSPAEIMRRASNEMLGDSLTEEAAAGQEQSGLPQQQVQQQTQQTQQTQQQVQQQTQQQAQQQAEQTQRTLQKQLGHHRNFLKSLGMSLEVIPDGQMEGTKNALGKAVNGYYDPNTRTVHVNPESPKALQFIVAHEMVHGIRDRSNKVYKSIARLIDDQYISGQELKRRYEEIKKRYKGIESSRTALREELIADVVGDVLDGDYAFARKLSRELENAEAGLGRRFINSILDAIDWVKERLGFADESTGSRMFEDYDAVKKELTKLLKEFQDKTREERRVAPVKRTEATSLSETESLAESEQAEAKSESQFLNYAVQEGESIKLSVSENGTSEEFATSPDAIGKKIMGYNLGNRPPSLKVVPVTYESSKGNIVHANGVEFPGDIPNGYVPKRIGYAYKLMEQWPDGSVHALFAGAKNPVPMGKWLYAAGMPKSDAGVSGMDLRPRYAWHLGFGLPTAPHLMSSTSYEKGYPSKGAFGHPKNSKRVWARIAFDASNDYNSIADQCTGGDIVGMIPFGGYYGFAEGNKSNWILSSGIMIDGILTEEERQAMFKDAGYDERAAWAERHPKAAGIPAVKAVKATSETKRTALEKLRSDIASSIIDNPLVNEPVLAKAEFPEMAKRENAPLDERIQDVVPPEAMTALPFDNASVVNGKPIKYSVSSSFTAAGLEYNTDSDGEINVTFNGRKVDAGHPLTRKEVANADSPLNLLLDNAVALETMTEEQAASLRSTFTGLVNQALKYGRNSDGSTSWLKLDAIWRWAGNEIYKAVKKNGDAQYSKTVDLLTICPKTQELMNNISKAQVSLGRALNPAEVLESYLQTGLAGMRTPCPCCYVFSHWIAAGRISQTVLNAQEYYKRQIKELHGKSEAERREFWSGEIKRWQEYATSNAELIKEAKSYQQNAMRVMDGIQAKMEAAMRAGDTKSLDKLRAQYGKLNERYIAASKILDYADFAGWITYNLYNPSRNKLYDDYREIPKNVLLDFDRAGEVKKDYPATYRFKNSKGSNAGKAIETAAQNNFGEVVAGLAGESPDEAKNILASVFESGISEKEKAKRKQAFRAQMQTAIDKQKKSLWNGGQRFFSWSDNRVDFGPDMFMNFIQLQSLGGSIQAYTKQLEGAEMFGKVNASVNCSLMGKGKGYARTADGKLELVFSDVEGINHEEAFKLARKYRTVGNILVSMNETHTRVAMKDKRIFFIIPWHRSGLKTEILNYIKALIGVDISDFETFDHTDVQEDKMLRDGDKIAAATIDAWNDGKKSGEKFRSAFEIATDENGLTQSQKDYRALRERILMHTASKEDIDLAMKDEFLSCMLNSIDRVGVFTPGEYELKNISVLEYWDVNSTFDTADVNGDRYLEYCRRLGVKPKFTGIDNSKGVRQGDYHNDEGYWKLLIDRRMYDTDGKYQDNPAIDASGFSLDLIRPEVLLKKWGDKIAMPPTGEKSEDIAKATIKAIRNRGFNLAKPMNASPEEAVADFKKSLEEGNVNPDESFSRYNIQDYSKRKPVKYSVGNSSAGRTFADRQGLFTYAAKKSKPVKAGTKNVQPQTSFSATANAPTRQATAPTHTIETRPLSFPVALNLARTLHNSLVAKGGSSIDASLFVKVKDLLGRDPAIQGWFKPHGQQIEIVRSLFSRVTLPGTVTLPGLPSQSELDGLKASVAKNTGHAADEIDAKIMPVGKGRYNVIFEWTDPRQFRALQTLSHEIGHLADFSSDMKMGHGNILGIINGIGKFFNSTLGESAKSSPRFISPSLMQKIKTMSDNDLLASEGMKDIGEFKAKYSNADDILRERRANAVKAYAYAHNMFLREEINNELYALSKKWRPFDEQLADPAYVAYRKSPKEIFADAISVLMNDPDMLKREAPEAWRALTNWDESRQEFWKAYQEAVALINSPESIAEMESERMREGYAKGFKSVEEGRKLRMLVKQQNSTSWWDSFLRTFQNKFVDVFKAQKSLEKSGKMPREVNAIDSIEQMTHNSTIQWYNDSMLAIVKDAMDKGLTADELGELLELHRKAYDPTRQNKANAGGLSAKDAEEILGQKKLELGQKWQAWEDFHRQFTDIRAKSVLTRMEESKAFDPEYMQSMKDNTAYARFDVNRTLDPGDTFNQNYVGTGLGIHSVVGSLQDIKNPLWATINYDMSILSQLAKHNARRDIIDTMTAYMKEQQGNAPQWILKPKMPGQEAPSGYQTWMVRRNGKTETYFVLDALGKAFDASVFSPELAGRINAFTNFWRVSLTQLRPTFTLGNIQRDLRTAMIALPPRGSGIDLHLDFLKYYAKGVREAFGEEFSRNIGLALMDALKGDFEKAKRDYMAGKGSDVIDAIRLANYLLPDSVIRGDIIGAETGAASANEKEWRDIFMPGGKNTPFLSPESVIGPLKQLRDFCVRMNNVFEMATKIASKQYLDANFSSMPESMKRHITINQAGSPDWAKGGSLTKLSNAILMFSNAQIQGTAASIEAAKTNPLNFMANVAVHNIIPRMIMFGFAKGVFLEAWRGIRRLAGNDDDDETAKLLDRIMQMYAHASRYMKGKYLLIPLCQRSHVMDDGTDQTDVTFFRLTMDDFSAPIGTAAWAFMEHAWDAVKGKEKEKSLFAELLAEMVEMFIPSNVNPGLLLGVNTFQYATDNNPTNLHTMGRGVPERNWRAGGWERLKEFLKYANAQYGFPAVTIPKSDDAHPYETFFGNLGGLSRFLITTGQGIKEEERDSEAVAQRAKARISLRIEERLKAGDAFDYESEYSEEQRREFWEEYGIDYDWVSRQTKTIGRAIEQKRKKIPAVRTR